MADNGLSKQDIADLQDISARMKPDDPRRAKLNLLLNSAPTQFEQERDPNNFKSGASNAFDTIKGFLKMPQAQNPYPGMGTEQKVEASNAATEADQQRKASGRSLGYRSLVPVAESVGADVPRMEHNADIGNKAGIIGNAVGSALPAVAAPALAEVAKLPTRVGMRRGMDSVALGSETPAQILTRAMKPPVTYPEFENVAEARIPEIIDHAKQNKTPINGVNDFTNTVDSLKDAKNQQFQDLKAPFKQPTAVVGPDVVPASGPFRPAAIDASPVADAQMHSIPKLERIEQPGNQTFVQRGSRMTTTGDPGIVAKTADKASAFRREMPLSELDDVRVDANAKLNSFYNKAGGDQHAALSNPETARVKAIRDHSADLVYGRLKSETGVDPAPIQDAYGDYADLGTVSGKRGVVFNRQQPFPLQEQINSGAALANGKPLQFAIGRMFRRYGNSDALTRIAVDRADPSIEGPSSLPVIPRGVRPVTPIVGALRSRTNQMEDEDQ